VYADTSTEAEPQLSSAALQNVHHQLDSMLAKLEKAVMDIIKDVEAKKKVFCLSLFFVLIIFLFQF
jgi:hypothetical protein